MAQISTAEEGEVGGGGGGGGGKIEESDYDGKIMAQERLLEKEVQESAPLVGRRSQASSLGEEYATDPVYLRKIAVRERERE